jgi:hypothetical protein
MRQSVRGHSAAVLTGMVRHAGNTSSDVPPMIVQSETIGLVYWEFHCALARI